MEDKQDEQQPNLPTIRESRIANLEDRPGLARIESQIWQTAKKACCLLLARIEASENAGKALGC